MSERTRMIQRWVGHNINPPTRRGRGFSMRARSIWLDDNYASLPAEGIIAAFMRSGVDDKIPLLRMGLPNELSIIRWREVYSIAESMGVQVVVIPGRVLDRSDIVRPSIVLIDSEKRPARFRPPQQLIKATVRPWSSRAREAYFMSGYDLRERGLSYFFCELQPDAQPRTVEEAYQSLKPESVLRAEAQKRKILRQGDMFFIRMQGEEGPDRGIIRHQLRLFDTNHFVSEGGWREEVLMVRGRVTHNPAGRRRDHRPLILPGRDWWIAVRNTVPVSDGR